MNKKKLISIVGPTAIGKTTLAIAIAKHYKTEIISADSRQFYKEMSIGTAVPAPEELASVLHHFIQHKSIFEKYTVGDFEREAIEKLELLFKDKALGESTPLRMDWIISPPSAPMFARHLTPL